MAVYLIVKNSSGFMALIRCLGFGGKLQAALSKNRDGQHRFIDDRTATQASLLRRGDSPLP